MATFLTFIKDSKRHQMSKLFKDQTHSGVVLSSTVYKKLGVENQTLSEHIPRVIGQVSRKILETGVE